VIARVETVVDTVFGQRLADPYRWMEKDGPELRAWLGAQADRATRHLAALPDRDGLLARISDLTRGSVTVKRFALAGRRVFFLRQDETSAVPVLAVCPIADGGETHRVLLDPAVLAETGSAPTVFAQSEHCTVDWFFPSPDGRLVACGIARSGSERTVLRVLDTATGELDDTAIPGTDLGVVSWLPDGSGFAYHRYPEATRDTAPERRRHNSATYLHRIGQHDDVLVLARGHNNHIALAPRDRPLLLLPAASDWMIALISHSALGESITEELSDCTLYAAPRSALADPASCPWRRIWDPADAVTAFAVHGDTLYAVSHKNAPRSEVLAFSLADGGSAVVLPGSERVVQGVRVVGGHVLVRDLDGGIARLRRVPLAGGPAEEVALPVQGTLLEWTGDADGAVLVLSSWTRSPAAYHYDGVLRETGWIEPSPVDFSGIEVRELCVPARDGAQIPLSILHRRGLPLDAENPTLLSGYGSYGYVVPREFTPQLLAWLERGGVYALAGLRGGGEYGPEWHRAGRRAHKERTITDFIDCAEHLIRSGYTRPSRLAGEGASAGGIPTGGALVRRPDLWAAMVMQVPLTNATRVEFSENGPINTPEFGSVVTEDGLRDLLIIDSYLRVTPGTAYPAVLLTAGLNDPRVAVWLPAKMAARLQAATTSTAPVLLRVDAHAGHGVGSTRDQRNALTADIFAFLLARLTGSLPAPSPPAPSPSPTPSPPGD